MLRSCRASLGRETLAEKFGMWIRGASAKFFVTFNILKGDSWLCGSVPINVCAIKRNQSAALKQHRIWDRQTQRETGRLRETQTERETATERQRQRVRMVGKGRQTSSYKTKDHLSCQATSPWRWVAQLAVALALGSPAVLRVKPCIFHQTTEL